MVESGQCWDWTPIPETSVGGGGEHGHSTPALSSPRSDPGQCSTGVNSLEFWDYSVELECIQGQQGSMNNIDDHLRRQWKLCRQY